MPGRVVSRLAFLLRPGRSLPSLLSYLGLPSLFQRLEPAERRLDLVGHRLVRPHMRTPMRRVAERALYHEHVLARLDFPAADAQQHVVHPVESVADGQLDQAGLHAGASFVRLPHTARTGVVTGTGGSVRWRIEGAS